MKIANDERLRINNAKTNAIIIAMGSQILPSKTLQRCAEELVENGSNRLRI